MRKLNTHEHTKESYSNRGTLSTVAAVFLGLPETSTSLRHFSVISLLFGQFHGGKSGPKFEWCPRGRGLRKGQQEAVLTQGGTAAPSLAYLHSVRQAGSSRFPDGESEAQ